ncbi:MAG: ABC transporter permease [Pyrinomonadaceae bacterium]
MKFILRLTTREIRSSWRRLLFFFLCISIGTGSIIAIRSIIANAGNAIGGDARALLTADIRIRSTNPLSPKELSVITRDADDAGIVDAENEFLETSAMARNAGDPDGAVKFVSIRGIEPPFPLVGNFVLTHGKFEFDLLKNGGAVVAAVLLQELNLKIGDKFLIGDRAFTVNAAFDEEPGGTGGLQLGARVYVEKKQLEDLDLLRNRSRVTHNLLLRTTSNPTALTNKLREDLKDTPIRIQNYRESQERLNDQFSRIENYLSLTGLLILVLGGIGVWNVARVFVEQKRSSVAILKCLGASGERIVLVYTLQILILGFLGSLFGYVLAQASLWLISARFGALLPNTMSYNVSAKNMAQGLILGVLISFLFSILPLLQIRNIKPSLLLRDENNTNLKKLDKVKWAFGFASIVILLGLAVWQSGSVQVGAFFLGGLALVSAALYLIARILTTALRSIKHFGNFSLSQAINSLYRPGNQTRVILLAVGLGTFVVLSVQMLQTNLVREFDLSNNNKLPSLFFIDIQPSQVRNFERIVTKETGEEPELIPTVRARIAYVNGKPINFNDKEIKREQGRIGREFTLTYRNLLESNESVIEGEWWSAAPAKYPEVSVEEEMARDLKVESGDTITFEISGRLLTAQVAGIRKIDLKNTRTVFIFVFRPGVLEDAPQTYAANLIRRMPATKRQQLQRNLIDDFPNIQIFDVAEIVKVFQNLVENFALAVSFIGGFVMLTGILILVGSVALTRSQRIYENAILKTLGASRFSLLAILLSEYGLLGMLAGFIGSVFAILLTWAVSVYVLDIEWNLDLFTPIIGTILTMLIVLLVGTAASFGLIFRKPLATLRAG